jgi:hypothetical protein
VFPRPKTSWQGRGGEGGKGRGGGGWKREVGKTGQPFTGRHPSQLTAHCKTHPHWVYLLATRHNVRRGVPHTTHTACSRAAIFGRHFPKPRRGEPRCGAGPPTNTHQHEIRRGGRGCGCSEAVRGQAAAREGGGEGHTLPRECSRAPGGVRTPAPAPATAPALTPAPACACSATRWEHQPNMTHTSG